MTTKPTAWVDVAPGADDNRRAFTRWTSETEQYDRCCYKLTPLYAHPAEHKETDAESRAAWIAVVLQKHPAAEIKVVGLIGYAKLYNGRAVGEWLPSTWWVK